jgi:hypothetical protein
VPNRLTSCDYCLYMILSRIVSGGKRGKHGCISDGEPHAGERRDMDGSAGPQRGRMPKRGGWSLAGGREGVVMRGAYSK